MLATYLAQVNRLLHNSSGTLYTTADLTSYINLARNQIAMEGECIKVITPLNTATGVDQLFYFDVTLPSGQGLMAVYSVANIFVNGLMLEARSWPWFSNYYLQQLGGSGVPSVWAQYQQGALGSAYLRPTPAGVYPMFLDTVCVPIGLATDSDVEAIPYPWQDCVQFFACYFAFLSAQRFKDAADMFGQYEFFARRARAMTTPTILPGNYEGGAGAKLASAMTPIMPIPASPPGGRGQG